MRRSEWTRATAPEKDEETAADDAHWLDEDSEELDAEKHQRLLRDTIRFPVSYQKDLLTFMYIHMALNGLYFVALVVYALLVLPTYSNDIYYGYYRPDLKPGPFTNDRYSFSAIFLGLMGANLVGPLLSMWMLEPITQSWKREVHKYAMAFFLLLNTTVVVTLLVSWLFLCNRGLVGFALCNADQVTTCRVYGAWFSDRCMPTVYPAAPASILYTPTAFWIALATASTFVLCNALLLVTNHFISKRARKYVEMSAIKQF